MKTLNKHVHSSVADNKNWKSELPQFLRQHRATPHSLTGISPFEILTGRQMNIGLPQLLQNTSSALIHPCMTQNDHISKSKMKMYTNTKHHTKPSDLQVSDHVLVKQPKTDKLTPPYNPKPFTIIKRKGSMFTAQQGCQQIVRNSSHFRRMHNYQTASDEEEEEENDTVPDTNTDTTWTDHQDSEPQSPQETLMQSPKTPTSTIPITTDMHRTIGARTMPVIQRPIHARKTPVHRKDYVLNWDSFFHTSSQKL